MQLSVFLTIRTTGLLDNVAIKNTLYFLFDIVNDKIVKNFECKIRPLKMHFTPSH